MSKVTGREMAGAPAQSASERRRSRRSVWIRRLPHLGWLLLLAPFTWSQYNMSQAAAVVVLIIVAVGYNLIVGYSGQFVMFSAAMVGIGAYGMAWLLEQGIAWPVDLVAVMAATGVAGYLVGAATVRFQGIYLALVSVGLSEAVGIVLSNWSVTGGEDGLAVPNISLGGSNPPSAAAIYFLVLLMTVISLLVAWRLTSSQWARNLKAVSHNEIAATVSGINPAAVRRTVVGVGSIYWGLAGGLSAIVSGYLSPDDYSLTQSTSHLAMIVVGGLGTFAGPVIGAVVLGAIPDVLKFSDSAQTLLFAGILYLVVLTFPGGLHEGFVRIGRLIGRRLGLTEAELPEEPEIVLSAGSLAQENGPGTPDQGLAT
jgi:branched-chain amino acid transport system permease protein